MMKPSNEALRSLVHELHELSDAQSLARARAQFRGTDDDFAALVGQYRALAPRLRGQFLKTHGLSTDDADDSPSAELSLAISADMGSFLQQLVFARRARRILELGSSYGVSTLYFADALHRLGEGTVIATELDAVKCTHLRAHVEAAGLAAHVDVRQGDVFETVAALDGPFDLVFLDVWANQYLELFRATERLLHRGSIVVTDNMFTAEDSVRAFKRYLDDHPRLSSLTLDFESGVELTVVVSGA